MKKIVMIDDRKDIVEQCSGFPDWLQIIPPETDLFEETCDFIKDLYLDNELGAVVLGDGPEGDANFLIDICDFIFNSKMEVKVILSTWNSEAAREFKAACPEIFYFPFNSGYLKFLEGFLEPSIEGGIKPGIMYVIGGTDLYENELVRLAEDQILLPKSWFGWKNVIGGNCIPDSVFNQRYIVKGLKADLIETDFIDLITPAILHDYSYLYKNLEPLINRESLKKGIRDYMEAFNEEKN